MKLPARLGVAAVCLTCACCAIVPRRRIEAVVLEPPAVGARWAIGTIAIEGSGASVDSRASLEEMLLVIATRRGLPLEAGGEAPVVLDIKVTEREFASDLQVRSSIAFSALLRDRASGAILARTLLTEESTGTTGSAYYLQGLADAVLGRLAEELAKARKEA